VVLAADQANNDVQDDGEHDTDQQHAQQRKKTGTTLELNSEITREITEIPKNGKSAKQQEKATQKGTSDSNQDQETTKCVN
jgi:hypothetical protein